jgi:hypothetical protein
MHSPMNDDSSFEDPYLKKSFVLMIEEKYRQWDVIAKSGYGYIALSHDALFRMAFGSTDKWKDAYCRSYLYDVWLAPIKTALSLKNVPEEELLDYQTERSLDKLFLLSKSAFCDWKKIFRTRLCPTG